MLTARMLRLAVAGVAVVALHGSITHADSAKRALEVMKGSFKERGQAKLDRLDQDEAQALCSRSPAVGALPSAVAERIQNANLAAIPFPAGGALMGNWREGEKIAQSGVGKQFSDDPARPSGGNCYACHQLSRQEMSFGTIGPSLNEYGKSRGTSVEMQRYVYGKIYNSQAYRACSTMPRFGHKGILTEDQIAHLVALLLDPGSPVNQ